MNYAIKQLLKNLRKEFKETFLFWLVLTSSFICTILNYTFWHFEHHKTPINKSQVIDNIAEHACDFLWLELIAGFVIWKLLEHSVKKYLDIPRNVYGNDHNEMSREVENCDEIIRIFDNDINPYYVGHHSPDYLEKLNVNKSLKNEFASKKIRFDGAIDFFLRKSKLRNLQYKKVEILLLHPNSLAALQRSQDLKNAIDRYDIFEEMKEGLARLHHTIQKYNKNEKKVIDVKFFKASQSVHFVIWDDKMKFAFVPSDRPSDRRYFRVSIHSPIAQSFIDNFESLWKNENTTVDFEDYMEVTLCHRNGVDKLPRCWWGADSPNHHKPVYVCINSSSIHAFERELNEEYPVMMMHNRELSWVYLREIKEEDKENREYAIKRITKQYYVERGGGYTHLQAEIRQEILNKKIYKIVPCHRYKIRLEEGNYVAQHLQERGYCYTPSTMYDVFIGMTLTEMLPAIYDLYKRFDEKILNEFKFSKTNNVIDRSGRDVLVPSRIIWSFLCIIDQSEIIVSEFSENDIKNNVTNIYANITWQELNELIKIDEVDLCNVSEKPEFIANTKSFVVSTIKADVDFILGKSLKPTKEEKNVFRNPPKCYLVSVHFIQSKVNNSGTAELNPQADSYSENRAQYTVMHNIGKKNITGGFSELMIDNKVIREYNLTAPLDSLYLQKEIEGKSVKLAASNIRFSKFESLENLKKEIKRGKKMNGDLPDEFGYRNLLCIEFFEYNL